MLGIYLIVTFFSKLASQSGIDLNNIMALQAQAQQVSVQFDRLNGITVGAPVYAEGEVVGSVSKITVSDKETIVGKRGGKADATEFSVAVDIKAEHRDLVQPGMVALISCPLSATRENTEAVVELIAPVGDDAQLRQAAARYGSAAQAEILSVIGYSSYEQFWANDRRALRS